MEPIRALKPDGKLVENSLGPEAAEVGLTNKPIQGADITCTVEGYDLQKGLGWVKQFKVTTDANGFCKCETSITNADNWSITASLPAGDARKFSKVEAPGSPTTAGQTVSYQSLQGLPKQVEIRFYFKK